MTWREEQVTEICRLYSLNGFSLCPSCNTAVEIVKEAAADGSRARVTFSCPSCNASTTQVFMTVGPEDFVFPPYTTCASCQRNELGLLAVSKNSYTQRCRSCRATETRELPTITKKVIYLDQMAISKMMLALNPDKGKAGRVDPRWRVVFDRASWLLKAQVAVFPESPTHLLESVVHPAFEALRAMYQYLSGGAEFDSPGEIERFQIHAHFGNWLGGAGPEAIDVNRRFVLHGGVDDWTDRLQVVVRGQMSPEMVEAIRAERDGLHEGLSQVFEKWKVGRRTFDQLYEDEVLGFGGGILQAYGKAVGRMMAATLGMDVSVDDLMLTTPTILVTGLQREAEGRGLGDQEALEKVLDYLKSRVPEAAPAVRLSALLWASVARKAQSGMKGLSRGEANDIALISALLPYCDAMFIDGRMKGYLEEEPLKTRISYPTTIFAEGGLDQFLAFLEELQAQVGEQHLRIVRSVYGDDWLEPYNPFATRGA